MKITTKNLKAKKKQLVTLACKIARARDGKCRFCGRATGKLDSAHVIPRSQGWRYAVDTANILTLCARCHRLGNPSWHSDETWGWGELRKHCPEMAEYCEKLHYSVKPVGVIEARKVAHELEQAANYYEVG